ncbi:class Ib ribonucleoside-diphosphate reductase assembly flavoprotein NrdI [Streptococcus equi subsp. zooepidemicus]|uniref:class Ib ribonucleoside-diphosphate reductase assembly flavoprotein NrdI n=1 Tax=Streptococcus equi TaxID=1336 RepID=UPI001E3DC0E2|nr:class Ib ribonucleoside-diphosphate reductase assembly flavoprotein NrdI [Streptococcus equi]MCD3412779.1 class Ib ribonucleoside-diphosphate reductase assembly flavoprotein NrdI [Streptococcus equi subsp. zooepidemicus]MCD3412780.1 class Ib ribonucleoside-diphosphate reductase assembly flavoprotein NrdI [Streptococcus equi subsp. zooepidemicus]MCD3413963.1 class Ib ribonucleoside-diphosphate reductase assembly flavoprotein NrdI [Streptococcus equi subsp. zooepidemicus]
MAARVMLVYFSSRSNNTHRFVQKLDAKALRIPISGEPLLVDEDYILIVPTYAAGGSDSKGAVPKQVIHFLNKANNRKHCKGVISSGNTNFGDTFAIAGPIITQKLQVPLLHQFELLGTQRDVIKVQAILAGDEAL